MTPSNPPDPSPSSPGPLPSAHGGQVDDLLERLREWRAVAPKERWIEMVCQPSAGTMIWRVRAWNVAPESGEVRVMAHEAADLAVALERLLAEITPPGGPGRAAAR